MVAVSYRGIYKHVIPSSMLERGGMARLCKVRYNPILRRRALFLFGLAVDSSECVLQSGL